MDTLTGTCRFCHQTRIVNATNQTGADELVTMQCDCAGAVIYQRKINIKTKMAEILDEKSDEIKALAGTIANHVMDGEIDAASVNLGGETLKISVNTKGLVKISLKVTKEIGGLY